MSATVALRHAQIGRRIKAIREERKIRQIDLATKAQMSWRHLIRMEQGKGGEPKAETLDRLAEALGVSRAELTGDPDDEEPSRMPLTADDFALLGDLMARLGRTLVEARPSNPVGSHGARKQASDARARWDGGRASTNTGGDA